MSEIPDESPTPIRSVVRRVQSDRTPEEPGLPDEAVYRLLENRRRRYLLYCLLAHEGEVSLSRAVDLVTAWENDCPVEDVRSTDRRHVYSALRRTHIPRLETENVAAYDEDAGTVSLDRDAEKATRWLVPDELARWSRYYLGLAAVSGTLVVADFLAVLPTLIPSGIEHAVVAVSFLALTVLVVCDQYGYASIAE